MNIPSTATQKEFEKMVKGKRGKPLQIRGISIINNPNITSIPDHLQNIYDLTCESCPLLVKIPKLANLEYLTCKGCEALEEISGMPKLETLTLHECPNLREIPESANLEVVLIRGCTALTKIHDLPCLKGLGIRNCPKLVDYPYLKPGIDVWDGGIPSESRERMNEALKLRAYKKSE